jgi:hypothetical protein
MFKRRKIRLNGEWSLLAGNRVYELRERLNIEFWKKNYKQSGARISKKFGECLRKNSFYVIKLFLYLLITNVITRYKL